MLACNSCVNEPSAAAPAVSATSPTSALSKSVHDAGTSDLLPSGSTTNNSNRPRARRCANTGNCLPRMG